MKKSFWTRRKTTETIIAEMEIIRKIPTLNPADLLNHVSVFLTVPFIISNDTLLKTGVKQCQNFSDIINGGSVSYHVKRAVNYDDRVREHDCS